MAHPYTPRQWCNECERRYRRAMEFQSMFDCRFKLCESCLDRALKEKKDELRKRLEKLQHGRNKL